MSSNRKPKYIIEYQTFRKADLEDAINYECARWANLRKLFPSNTEIEVPFDVRDAYWPDIEKSQELRAKMEKELLPPPPQYNAGQPIKVDSRINIPPPHQNASQFSYTSTDTPEYLKKYHRGLLDAEERRLKDLDDINREYAQALEDMVKSQSLGASNMSDSMSSFLVKSISGLGSSEDIPEKPKNDFKEDPHWLWKYCIPYVTVSGVLAALAHFIALR